MKKHFKKRSTTGKADSKPTIIVDCSALAYASKYAYGVLSYNGESTGVIYGFLKKVLSLAKRFDTNKFIFCWDSGGETVRMKSYPNYKKRRREKQKLMTPEEKNEIKEVVSQRETLRRLILPAIGFQNSFGVPGFEGDDIIAYFVNKLHSKRELLILSPDSDMYQLLDRANQIIKKPKKKESVFTKDHLLKKFGVRPDQWPYAKAIGGCSGDGVEGIKGVSDPKNVSSKALKYILGTLTKGVIFDRIETKRSERIIKRNIGLVTIPHNDLNQRMIIRRDQFKASYLILVFDRLRFRSFIDEDQFKHWRKYFGDQHG